jgi:hypothetical protein
MFRERNAKVPEGPEMLNEEEWEQLFVYEQEAVSSEE